MLWGVNIRPISKNIQDIELKYNESTGKYEGEFFITEETQSGTWKVLRIFAQDNNYNCKFIYNKDVVEDASGEIADLSKGNIKVSETNVTSKDDVDMIGPTIYEDTVSVDKSYVEKGDKVKVSLKAVDKSGISRITVNYQGLTGDEFKHVNLEFNKETGYFEGYINIDDNFKEGTYRIWNIMAIDNENNSTVLYSKDTTEKGEWKVDSILSSSGKIMELLFSLDSESKLPFKKVDLSMGNFEVR